MRVIFLGVGEACDEILGNTSLVLQDRRPKGATVMLDCGFSAPPYYWARFSDPNLLDALWISHFHGDHFFGLPQLLLHLWQQGRNKPLRIVCQKGGQEKVLQVINLAYSFLLTKMSFKLLFQEVDQEQSLDLLGFHWSFCKTWHPEPNLALGLQAGAKSIYFSGDGAYTDSCLDMARNCSLVVHEAYLLQGQIHGHCSIIDCLHFARECSALKLALVHMQRQERLDKGREIKEVLQGAPEVQAFMPVPGQEVLI